MAMIASSGPEPFFGGGAIPYWPCAIGAPHAGGGVGGAPHSGAAGGGGGAPHAGAAGGGTGACWAQAGCADGSGTGAATGAGAGAWYALTTGIAAATSGSVAPQEAQNFCPA